MKLFNKVVEFAIKKMYSYKSSSESLIEYLRSRGAVIGEGVYFFTPHKAVIDCNRPWLIEIGNDVQIAEGITILTHGFDWSVLKGIYGDVLGSAGSVKIGNNVFIGMNVTILKGVTIGNNCIIGLGSVVTKDIPDNSVAVGNPARVISSIDEYYKKRKESQLKEATELVKIYRERFGKDPDENALSEFFWLFADGDTELHYSWKEQMKVMRNEEFSKEMLTKNNKMFYNMQEFLDSID